MVSIGHGDRWPASSSISLKVCTLSVEGSRMRTTFASKSTWTAFQAPNTSSPRAIPAMTRGQRLRKLHQVLRNVIA